MKKYYAGLDLGGTFVKGGIVDEEGKILVKDKIPTGRERPYTEIAADMARLVKDLAVEDDLGAIVLGVVHLHQGGGGGHDDGGLHPGVLGGIGHALGVVARGGGDQPAGLLLVAEGADLIVGAPDLVRAGELHVLRLDVHLVAGGLGKGGAVDQRGVPDHTGEHAAGLFEIFECEHGADFLSVG